MSYQSKYSGGEVDESVLNYLCSRVNTLDELNALDTSKLKDGWKCYIISTDTEYKWKNGKWNKLSTQNSLITDNYSESGRTGSKIDKDGANIDKVQIMNFIKAINYVAGSSGFNISQEGIGEFKNIISNLMSFLKGGITIGSYNPGLTGSGAKIGKDGNAEMRGLVLWETLQVPQLSFNRVEVLIGMDFQSSGGGLIESVTIDKDADGNNLSSGTVKLHLEEGEYGSVKVGDFCMGIFHNFGGANDTESSDSHTGNITKMGFLTSYFYITEITDTSTNGEFKYILREVSDSWTQQNHPSAHMNFAQRGNNIDTTRQSFKYRTTEYSIGLTGVNSWEFSDSNIYYLEGKLDGWTIGGKTFEGYGSVQENTYIYGKIDQFEKVGYLMTFYQTENILINGIEEILYIQYPSIAEGESIKIRAIIKDGYGSDVTNLFTDWTVTRNTGDNASDNIWNTKASIIDGSFSISWTKSNDDFGGKNTALFTVTAYKPGYKPVIGALQI